MTIGIIQWLSPLQEVDDPYYLSIRQGVEDYCYKNRISIKRVFKTDIDYLDNLKDIQGLICIGKYNKSDIITFKKICSNIIFIDMNIDPINECCIVLDFKNAIKKVIDYLKINNQTIIYLGGKEYIDEQVYPDPRKKYFEEYSLKNNIKYKIIEDKFSIESGFNMTNDLIMNNSLPDAIFAASDPIAIGALKALKEHNIKVPEDISLIGFDNIETTNYTDPPLTTIFAPTFDMGYLGARHIYDAYIHNENLLPYKILVPCYLIERESCK